MVVRSLKYDPSLAASAYWIGIDGAIAVLSLAAAFFILLRFGKRITQ